MRGSIRAGFANNLAAIDLGLMAERYGKLPTEAAEIKQGEYTRLERFRINQDILYATEQFKEDNRDDPSSSGVGSSSERKELIQNQIDRSEQSHGSIAAQKKALS